MEIISSLPHHSDEAAPAPTGQSGWGRVFFLVLGLFLFAWGFQLTAERLQGNFTPSMASLSQLRALEAVQAAEPMVRPSLENGLSAAFHSWSPHLTLNGIAPLWPWLVAQQAATEETKFLQRGQQVNANVSLAFLIAFGLMAATRFSLLATFNLLLLLGGGVLLPLSLHYSPDTLFAILYLMALLCGIRLLKRNPAWLHVIFGGICALGYLTKVSIAPLIILWALITTLWFLASALRRNQESPWNCRCHFIGLLGFSFAFLVLTAPHFDSNKQQFGSYWQPLHEEYLKVNQQPTIEQLRAGSAVKFHQLLGVKPLEATAPDGTPRLLPLRGVYPWALMGCLLVAATYARTRGPAWFQDGPPTHRHSLPVVLFVLLSLAVGIGIAALTDPTTAGEHFLLYLYGPIVATTTMAGESLRKWAERRGGGGRGFQLVYQAIHLTIATHLLISFIAFHQNNG